VPAVAEAAQSGDLMFGTIDSWLIYKLTGGEVHATDVTNASRTMLMDIRTRQWCPKLCGIFGVPIAALPAKILPSASAGFGTVSLSAFSNTLVGSALGGVPISGCIGDQSGALVGQLGFGRGSIKNTFGTGCFLLANVGSAGPVFSRSGLLTTIAFQLGDNQPCFYALEGAVAGAGSAVQWLRDKLQIIGHAEESETLASSVPDAGGVSFVPAFGGLLAPHWCPAARGTIVGLTQQSTKAHIARATLEAVSQQVSSLVRCVEQDLAASSSSSAGGDNNSSSTKKKKVIAALKVDGGMAANNVLMQLQADALGVPVLRPQMLETTAKGAALCAALGAGALTVKDLDKLAVQGFTKIEPKASAAERERLRAQWERAVKTAIAHSKL
jgi:glycerol kinase